MTYSSFNLSLILASGLGKTRQDQARRAVHVHQGQAKSALIRSCSPTIGRCPSDSGFLAGRARVGPGSAGRAAKSNPLRTNLALSLECLVKCLMKCSVQCSMKYSVKCLLKCSIEYSVECSVKCSVECLMRYLVKCL